MRLPWEEAQAVSHAALAATGAQKAKAKKDAMATGVSLVLFWPAVFLVGGDDETAAEVSQMKGHIQAIELASKKKDCGIVFDTAQSSATGEAKPLVESN